MRDSKALIKFIYECFLIVGYYFHSLRRITEIIHENVMTRFQLEKLMQRIEDEKIPLPRASSAFRCYAVIISKCSRTWKSAMFIVKADTVTRCWSKGKKIYWRWKSGKPGRPKISRETIALIKRIHKENLLWSPEKIHEQLINLNVTDAPAPNTISKYLPQTRKPRSEKQQQSWRTLFHNHLLWSMDLFSVMTLRFQVLYVFVIVSHHRRRIEHIAVTEHPTAEWIVQQIRYATPFGNQPKYLFHDNEPAFVSFYLQNFLSNANIKSIKTSYRSPWQVNSCSTQYYANRNVICERTIKSIRDDVLNHVIPLNQNHLIKTLHEYVNDYYNPCRTHQGIGGQTPDASPPLPETTCAETKLVSKKILGGLYYTYTKEAA